MFVIASKGMNARLKLGRHYCFLYDDRFYSAGRGPIFYFPHLVFGFTLLQTAYEL